MRGGEIAGDPDELARAGSWHQPIFHLHGYTPRRLFLITKVEFVFSTAQYSSAYDGGRRAIIDKVLHEYLANPVHIALYTGCSFSDEAMNDLLRDAATRYPGRMHYALLKWPVDRGGVEPDSEEIEERSRRYVEMGVQPVWLDDYAEIPEIIRSLK